MKVWEGGWEDGGGGGGGGGGGTIVPMVRLVRLATGSSSTSLSMVGFEEIHSSGSLVSHLALVLRRSPIAQRGVGGRLGKHLQGGETRRRSSSDPRSAQTGKDLSTDSGVYQLFNFLNHSTAPPRTRGYLRRGGKMVQLESSVVELIIISTQAIPIISNCVFASPRPEAKG